MGVSQGQFGAGRARTPNSGHRFQKILYRARALAVLAASAVSLSAATAAQEGRPQIMPGERKVSRKKDAGPRALGLLRLTKDGKISLVPVAILIDGKFWDAAAYKAAPVPMALEPGTVYEAERAGSSLGLFTIGSALHSNAVNAPAPWLATGKWLPTGREQARTTLKAETAPLGIDTSDAPPRLTRNPAKAPPSTTAPPASSPPPSPSSEDEPPRLSKPAAQETPPASTAPPSSAPPETKPDERKAGDRPKEPKEADTNSGATEADRPLLRRGKPTEPLPDEEIPGYSKPGALPSTNAAKTAETAAGAGSGSVQLIPAISDAGGPEPRPFTFEWLKDEERDRSRQMADLARQELRAYLDAHAKAKIPAEAPAPQPRRQAQKAPEPALGNAQLTAYDLWITNQPVLIFSAEAHLPPPPGAPGGIQSGEGYWVVLVAFPDIYNNLHKLYVGITDKYHLDVTPRLELIDAVDADGDGLGELLFRETSDAGTGWVIYRATADKLWKMYDSLNPE